MPVRSKSEVSGYAGLVQQEQFSESQQARTDHFATAEEERQTEFNQLVGETQSTADAELGTLRQKQDQAAKIIGIIGNIGVTGNYQRIADQEGRKANLFRWIAVGCMGTMLACVIVIVVSVSADEFSWEVALFRLLAVLAFAGPAWYCGWESERHRATEQRNRRIELELASMKPFVEDLPEEKQQEILADLAPEYFGGGLEEAEDVAVGEHLRGDELVKLVERLIKAVKG